MLARQAAPWIGLAAALAVILYVTFDRGGLESPRPKPASTLSNEAPDLIVIGNLAASERIDPGEKTEAEADQNRIRAYLDRTGLHYEFLFLPWGRAYRTAQERSNALLFNMLRTPEREELFHWLISMERSEPIHLVARKGSDQETMTLDEILASPCKAACVAGSAQCKALQDFGFARERIVEVAESQHGMSEMLLLRGRVDFIAELPSDLGVFDDEGRDIRDRLTVMMPLSSPNSPWLAAPRSIDPALLERLLAALPPSS